MKSSLELKLENIHIGDLVELDKYAYCGSIENVPGTLAIVLSKGFGLHKCIFKVYYIVNQTFQDLPHTWFKKHEKKISTNIV